MTRYVVCLLTFVLLAVASCAPSAPPTSVSASAVSPTQTFAPSTIALPTLNPSTLLGSPSSPWDANRVNDAARELKTGLREASGLRAQLGPQADEFFSLVDQAETAAVEDLLRKMEGNTKPKGMPAPLPPGTGSTRGAYQILGFASILATFLDAPNLVERPDYDRGMRDKPLSVKESDQVLGDNVRSHAKVETQVTGSRAEMDVEITIRGEKDGMVYEEHAHGKISLPICPDKEGKVPVDLSLQVSAGISQVGYQFQTEFTGRGVGLVDDEANLISLEQDGKTGTSLQKGKGAATGGEAKSVMEGVLRYTVTGLNTKEVSGANDRSEWRGTPKAPDEIGKLGNLAHSMALAIQMIALQNAEKKWKDGYCVAVRVDDHFQTVLAGSETPLTVRLQHQFEGMEMNLPIIATLKGGTVSITPSGVKVPAVATFRYKAPDTSGQEATLELVSRSRRGIGKLEVTFMTQVPYYRVDQAFGPKVTLAGDICALDKPFTLKTDGENAIGGKYSGDIAFTPASKDSGSWMHTASSCVAPVGCAAITGGGTYQVEGLAQGQPVIKINAPNSTGSLNGQVLKVEGLAYQIELRPAIGSCSAE